MPVFPAWTLPEPRRWMAVQEEEREEYKMMSRDHTRKSSFDTFQNHTAQLQAAWKLRGAGSS